MAMSDSTDRYQILDGDGYVDLGRFVADHRQAVLATVDEGAPYTAMVAYVIYKKVA